MSSNNNKSSNKSSNKSKEVKVTVLGGNCEDVTGSCTLVSFNKRNVLFECGMIQSGHDVLENYKANRDMIRGIKHKDKIEYVFIGHCHVDHIGMLPALYANGFKGKVVVPKGSFCILRDMLYDCAYINKRDAEVLSLKAEKVILPLYTDDDVATLLNNIIEVESFVIKEMDEELSIRYSPAGHILLSQQMEMFITLSNHTKKILFTSDLGNMRTEKDRWFVENFVPVQKAHLVVGECTYSAKDRGISKKDVELDREKIRTVVEQSCVEGRRRVLIPSFSLDRSPFILSILYDLFGKDEKFDVKVIIDSPLTNKLLDDYMELLEDDKKERFKEVLSWKNIIRIIDANDSKAAIVDRSPKIIISSSGMLTAGRSVKWTKSVLPSYEDCILFIGFCTDGTLGDKIKHSNNYKTISINGVPIKNNSQIVDLKSFSSHAQRDDLLNYYSSINADKICLVHSNQKSKIEFAGDLREEIKRRLRTTKVICSNRGTVITI